MSTAGQGVSHQLLQMAMRRASSSGCSTSGAGTPLPQQLQAAARRSATPSFLGVGITGMQRVAIQAGAARGYAARASSASLGRRLRALMRDYKQLSKARLSALVVATASAGFVAGSGEQIDWAGLAWTSLGTFGAAACANALNQVYETTNDRLMNRTCNRPLPAGRMARGHALAFAALAGAAGLWVLAQQTNTLTAGLGAANILLYAGVYTPLKQLSMANTWVGAVVGAIPPLMGWAAAAGSLEPGAWVLATALFCWQMPHFMALAWMCKEDYMRGGFRMISMLDPSGRRTSGVALRHCAALLPLGAAAAALGVVEGQWFTGEAAVLAGVMGAGAAAFYAAPSLQSARKLFKGSLIYLPLLLVGLVAHRQPNRHELATLADVRRKLEAEWGLDLSALSPEAGSLGAGLLGAPAAALRGAWSALPSLPSLPSLRLRSVEERLEPYIPELQALREQFGRCPSRVYGDALEGGEEGEEGGTEAEEGDSAAAAEGAQAAGVEGGEGATAAARRQR